MSRDHSTKESRRGEEVDGANEGSTKICWSLGRLPRKCGACREPMLGGAPSGGGHSRIVQAHLAVAGTAMIDEGVAVCWM